MRCFMLSIFLSTGLQLCFGIPLTHIELNRPKVNKSVSENKTIEEPHYSGLGRPADDPLGVLPMLDHDKRWFTNAQQGRFPYEPVKNTQIDDVELTTEKESEVTTISDLERPDEAENNVENDEQKRPKRGIFIGTPYTWKPSSLMRTFGLGLHNGGVTWNGRSDSYYPYYTSNYVDSYPDSIEDDNIDSENEDPDDIQANKIKIYQEYYYPKEHQHNNEIGNGFNNDNNEINMRFLPKEHEINNHVSLLLHDVHTFLNKDHKTDKDNKNELKDIKGILDDKDFIKRGVILQTNPTNPILNILEGNFTSIVQNNFSISHAPENMQVAHHKDESPDVHNTQNDINTMKEKDDEVDDETTLDENDTESLNTSETPDDDVKDEEKPIKDINSSKDQVDDVSDVATNNDEEKAGENDNSGKIDEDDDMNETDKPKEENSIEKAKDAIEAPSKNKGNAMLDLAHDKDFLKFIGDMVGKYIKNLNEQSKPTENQVPDDIENYSRKRKPKPNGNYTNDSFNTNSNKNDKKNQTITSNKPTLNNGTQINETIDKENKKNNKTESNIKDPVSIDKEKDKNEKNQTLATKPFDKHKPNRTHRHTSQDTNIYNFVGQDPRKFLDVLKPVLNNNGVNIFNFGPSDISKDVFNNINGKDEVVISANKEDNKADANKPTHDDQTTEKVLDASQKPTEILTQTTTTEKASDLTASSEFTTKPSTDLVENATNASISTENTTEMAASTNNVTELPTSSENTTESATNSSVTTENAANSSASSENATDSSNSTETPSQATEVTTENVANSTSSDNSNSSSSTEDTPSPSSSTENATNSLTAENTTQNSTSTE